MENKEVIQGGDIMLFVGGKSIAYATDHTLNMSTETRQTATKDDGGKWNNEEAGKKSWTVTSNNLYSNSGEGVTFNEIVDLWINDTPIEVVLCEKGEDTDVVPEGGWTPSTSKPKFKGMALITSIDVNAPNGDNASYSISMNGKGKLERITTA